MSTANDTWNTHNRRFMQMPTTLSAPKKKINVSLLHAQSTNRITAQQHVITTHRLTINSVFAEA